MRWQFSEMGQLGDEHLDTSETESMTAIVLPLEHTQDFIQKRNPSRVSLLPKFSPHRVVDRAQWIRLSTRGVYTSSESSAYCYHNGYEKECQRLGQKPERMRTELGLKLKGGWERVKFSEAGGGERNLAIHGEKFPSISPRLVWIMGSLEGSLDIPTRAWWKFWETPNRFQGTWPYPDQIPRIFEEIKEKTLSHGNVKFKEFDRHNALLRNAKKEEEHMARGEIREEKESEKKHR